MMKTYLETRRAQIYETISHQPLVGQRKYNNSELLDAMKSYSEALLDVVIDKEHAAHLTIRNLSTYLRTQAETAGIYPDDDIENVASELDKLSKRIHNLEQGVKGEARAARSIFGIDAPNRILRNIEIIIDDEPYEIDFVVVNKNGIHIIETKNYNKDMIIDENGYFTPAVAGDGQYGGKKINLVEQIRNQKAAVRMTLEKAFCGNASSITDNIQTLVMTTSNFKITDIKNRQPVVDCGTVIDYLNADVEKELTREEINALADAIEQISTPQAYEVNYDYDRLAHSFAVAVAKIEYAADKSQEDTCELENDYAELDVESNAAEAENEGDDILNSNNSDTTEETNRSTGWKVAGGLAVGAAVLGLGWKIVRRLL